MPHSDLLTHHSDPTKHHARNAPSGAELVRSVADLVRCDAESDRMRIQIAVMRNGFRVMRILIVEVRKPAVVSQMCVAMPPTCMGSDAKLGAAARIGLRMPQSERGVRPPA